MRGGSELVIGLCLSIQPLLPTLQNEGRERLRLVILRHQKVTNGTFVPGRFAQSLRFVSFISSCESSGC